MGWEGGEGSWTDGGAVRVTRGRRVGEGGDSLAGKGEGKGWRWVCGCGRCGGVGRRCGETGSKKGVDQGAWKGGGEQEGEVAAW